jgi:hypothetical protein
LAETDPIPIGCALVSVGLNGVSNYGLADTEKFLHNEPGRLRN